MANETRGYTRYPVWFPVTVLAPGGELWAVSRDASPGGILLSGTTSLEIGAEVTVTFRVQAEDVEHSVRGHVVRADAEEDDDPRGVWPHRMAVEFVEPLPQLDVPLRRASERPEAMPPSSRKSADDS
jgi:hypothetical protein